jgi:hypothetical protein
MQQGWLLVLSLEVSWGQDDVLKYFPVAGILAELAIF